ncbi:MAG: thiosulfate oxidation carrier protein SoxY [Gammaproteobacteria bacterium]|nr:thiosulfate oxidation carrier protein SoxY [Gammaproteobacteria bacterium]MBQ0839474.1 thiosulfate oxidation carrier protein SoxY [Gammaproteobacteria bacterium]
MKMNRRRFLGALLKGSACIAVATSLPRLAFAAWNEKAFKAETLEGALSNKYPGLEIVDSTALKLKAPAIAENGAVVPVSVKTDLPDVKSISLFVEKNPSPLAATFHLTPVNVADVSIRLRMGETSNLIAVVESGGKLHRAQQEVKVTIGGCGG